MEPSEPQDRDEPVDRAVAARLARLRTLPMDTTRLEKALHQQVPHASRRWPDRVIHIRPVPAAAASLLILSLLAGVLFIAASGPATASAAQMAQMHQDIVSGRTPVMQVDSIAAANQALSAQSPQFPQMPSMPADHVMACCMKNVKDKRIACLLLKDEGVLVTLSVAKAADMRTPASPVVVHDGETFHVQSYVTSTGTLYMVMTEKNGRWVCVIGQTSAGRLMDLAATLGF